MAKVAIVISTFNRLNLLKRTLESLEESLKDDENEVSIFIKDDASTDGTLDWLLEPHTLILSVSSETTNRGLRHCLNELLSVVSNDDFDYISYNQDDVEFKSGWLQKCIDFWKDYGEHGVAGFITCHDAPEHPVIAGGRLYETTFKLKKTCRATHLFASTKRWKLFGHIPDLTPGIAAPKPGQGSKVDWWLVGHPEGKYPESDHSLKKEGEFVVVIPGYIKHVGNEDSTWLPKNTTIVTEDGEIYSLKNPEFK